LSYSERSRIGLLLGVPVPGVCLYHLFDDAQGKPFQWIKLETGGGFRLRVADVRAVVGRFVGKVAGTAVGAIGVMRFSGCDGGCE
jgi:hypothetical protein